MSALTCAGCHTTNPPDNRFCFACRLMLPVPAAPSTPAVARMAALPAPMVRTTMRAQAAALPLQPRRHHRLVAAAGALLLAFETHALMVLHEWEIGRRLASVLMSFP